MKRIIVALAVALLLTAIPSFAQTTTYQTYTTAALAQGAVTMAVASATNMVASTQTVTTNAFIMDGFGNGELVKIMTLNGTTVGLQRGQGGTEATAHVSGAVVFFGPTGSSSGGIGNPFTNTSPQQGAVCNANQYQWLPIVNYANGSVWNCKNNRWVNNAYGVTGVTTSATVTLGEYIIAYTANTAASTLTMPTPRPGMRGKIYIVKDQTGNSSVYTIWVTGGTPNGATSIALFGTGGLQSTRLYTDGVSWFTW